MALSGTLKDFGIADILQLIGHQTKTGRLTLKTGQAEVEVSFKDGTVIFAEPRVLVLLMLDSFLIVSV